MKNKKSKPLKVIISGGGSGGHIFPAIAIANELRQREAQTELLFVGAKGKIEMEKVPKAGYPIEGLWISGLHRQLTLRNLLFPVKLLMSLWKAFRIIGRFRPDVVIGVGGYASYPTLAVASKRGIPTLIQEQNSYAGISNKLLRNSVDRVCVAYDQMERYFPATKIVLTGNPVRQDISNLADQKATAYAH
ncbi:MAG: glycosyltransferase, partial [Bacteroidota bacterium]